MHRDDDTIRGVASQFAPNEVFSTDRSGRIIAERMLGGLQHRYARI